VDKNEKKRFPSQKLKKNMKKRDSAMLKSSVITTVLSVYLSTHISRLKPSVFLSNLCEYSRFYLDIFGNTWKEYVEMYTRNAVVYTLFFLFGLMLKKLFFAEKRLKPKSSLEKSLCSTYSLETSYTIFSCAWLLQFSHQFSSFRTL